MAEKRKWSDKFKLAMGELENKIQREHRGRTAGAWPVHCLLGYTSF